MGFAQGAFSILVWKVAERMMSNSVWIALAALGLASSVPADDKPDITPLIETLALKTDTGARIDAAKRLGQSGSFQAVEALVKCLKDEHRPVRWAAIEALGDLGEPLAVPPLLDYIKRKEPYRWGKILAANALAAIKDPRARDPLFALLSSGDDAIPQRVVLLALARLGDERIVPYALDLLRDEAAWMRKTAQAALVQLAQERLKGGAAPRGYDAWAKWYQDRRQPGAGAEEDR